MTDKFEAAMLELKKAKNFQTASWAIVIAKAREYAQLKAHGTYIENGNLIRLHNSDVPHT